MTHSPAAEHIDRCAILTKKAMFIEHQLTLSQTCRHVTHVIQTIFLRNQIHLIHGSIFRILPGISRQMFKILICLNNRPGFVEYIAAK